jgi:hypothetical protein
MSDEIKFQLGDVVKKGAIPLLVVGIRIDRYLCLSFSFTAGGKFRDSSQYCYPAGELKLTDAITKLIVYRQAVRATGQKQNLLPRPVHDKIVATLEKESRGR